MNFDLAVIGGGAAGLAAAREATRRGARVALVEADRLGGDCTWSGCVPSKALIAAARGGSTYEEAYGRVRRAIAQVAAQEDAVALTSEGIHVVMGRAVFEGPRALAVDGRAIEASSYVVATGAGPSIPSVPGLAEVPFLTTETVFELERAPESLAVLGGGPVGCELAQALARLGVAVTLVEAEARLLASEEPGVSDVLAAVFRREGVDLRLGSAVVRASGGRAEVRLDLADGSAVVSEAVLVAAGRTPAGGGFGLDVAGVRLDDRGFVETRDDLRTTNRRVYAAGDVTGRMAFTHAADEMGRIAAANAVRRRKRTFSTRAIPTVVFTDPQVARVGPVEAVAPAGARIAELPLAATDRAVAEGVSEGLVRLVAVPRSVLRWMGGGRLVGGTIVAPAAGEMIHEVALAVRTRMFTGRLAQTVHAYPTWSLAVREAAAQFFMEVGGRRARSVKRRARRPRSRWRG